MNSLKLTPVIPCGKSVAAEDVQRKTKLRASPFNCPRFDCATAIRGIIILYIFLTCQSWLLATDQYPERIEYEDNIFEFDASSSPLAFFLSTHPEKQAKWFSRQGLGMLRRGYIALYRVSQGKLWLISMELPDSNADYGGTLGRITPNGGVRDEPLLVPFPLTRLFPDCAGAVQATWFTGDLKLYRDPTAEELAVDKTLSTRHEILTFKDGKLTYATKPSIQIKPEIEKGK